MLMNTFFLIFFKGLKKSLFLLKENCASTCMANVTTFALITVFSCFCFLCIVTNLDHNAACDKQYI